MDISGLADKALRDGYLEPDLEREVRRFLNEAPELDADQYLTLKRLWQAVRSGRVLAAGATRCCNVMEEMVWHELFRRVETEGTDAFADVSLGDVVAHALNRLPPLYATSARGAGFQRELVDRELGGMIVERVTDALMTARGQPQPQPREEVSGGNVLIQMDALLKAYAPRFESGGQAA